MSTLVGHSLLHALHSRHRSSTSFTAGSVRSPITGPLPARPVASCPDRASRKTLARPRVLCCSSQVAWYDGHMSPWRFLRHSPTPAQAPSPAPGRHRRRNRTSVGTSARHILGPETKLAAQRRRIDDFAGIEQVVRIESPFQFTKGLVEHRAEHLLHERTAHQAVAMFAGQGPAVLEHQVGHLVRPGFRN